MDMISVKEAASEWNMSPRRVSLLCSEGRIEGAEHFGNAWAIPKGTQKPTDARVRNIVITDEGKKKLEEARAFSASIETSLQSVISEEEKTSFITICNKLKNVLEESLC